jgi:hypothetical protein
MDGRGGELDRRLALAGVSFAQVRKRNCASATKLGHGVQGGSGGEEVRLA